MEMEENNMLLFLLTYNDWEAVALDTVMKKESSDQHCSTDSLKKQM